MIDLPRRDQPYVPVPLRGALLGFACVPRPDRLVPVALLDRAQLHLRSPRLHRADGGRTSLTNLKDYCWWHHHVVLHELGWELTVRPDGTSQVKSPAGKIIRSHSPPPRPG